LQRIQQLYYQNARRSAPIWIPPRGQTPPALVAVSSSGQRQQQVVMNAPTAAPSQQPVRRKTSRRRVLVGSLVAGTLLTLGVGVTWANSARYQPVTNSGSGGGQIPPQTSTPSEALTPDNSNRTPLVPHNGPTYWSADLRNAVVVNMNALEVYSTQPQKLRLTIPTGIYDPNSLQWAADNSKFCILPDSVVYSARTGKKLYTLPSLAEWTITSSVSWSPDGKYLMRSTGSYDANYANQTRLEVFSAKNGKSLFQNTTPGSDIANCMAWSPDSRYVAFPNGDSANWVVGGTWSVGIMDMTTFQQVFILTETIPPSSDMNQSSFTNASGVAWSPDGSMIAVALDLHAWICTIVHTKDGWGDEDNWNTGRWVKLDVPLGSVPLWSPDSSYVAFFSRSYVNVYDVKANQIVTLLSSSPTNTIAAMAWNANIKSITGVDDNNLSSTWTFV
jgi:hypothetical protein